MLNVGPKHDVRIIHMYYPNRVGRMPPWYLRHMHDLHFDNRFVNELPGDPEHGPRLPHHLVEPANTTMQVVGAVVGSQLVGRAIQREPALRNPVAVAADDGAEERVVLQVPVDRV